MWLTNRTNKVYKIHPWVNVCLGRTRFRVQADLSNGVARTIPGSLGATFRPESRGTTFLTRRRRTNAFYIFASGAR